MEERTELARMIANARQQFYTRVFDILESWAERFDIVDEDTLGIVTAELDSLGDDLNALVLAYVPAVKR